MSLIGHSDDPEHQAEAVWTERLIKDRAPVLVQAGFTPRDAIVRCYDAARLLGLIEAEDSS
jgi:hypothetical protein